MIPRHLFLCGRGDDILNPVHRYPTAHICLHQRHALLTLRVLSCSPLRNCTANVTPRKITLSPHRPSHSSYSLLRGYSWRQRGPPWSEWLATPSIFFDTGSASHHRPTTVPRSGLHVYLSPRKPTFDVRHLYFVSMVSPAAQRWVFSAWRYNVFAY